MRRGQCRGALVAVVLLLAGCEAGGSSTPPGGGRTPAPVEEVGPAPRGRREAAAPAPATPGLLLTGPEGSPLASEPGGRAASSLRPGVSMPFDAVEGGWAHVLTPCENRAWLPLEAAEPARRQSTVVLDPGHGGEETGAVGRGGLAEKEVNLDVARRAAEILRARGIPTALTRTGDYRATIAFRIALAAAVRPAALVSIHHNAEPDGPLDRPGTETYYQLHSPDSRRLAGLLYEEGVGALSDFSAPWVGLTDAGAKWRVNERGTDFYGVLRRSAEVGITAVLAEMAFVSNPAEEDLLRRDDVRQAEAEAIARAVARFLRTEDPGSGFVSPRPRRGPAGPGGGRGGCEDPSA